MPFVAIFTSLFSSIGGMVSSLFGFKGEQAQSLQEALKTLGEVDANDAKSVVGLANAMQIILSQGSWMERNWRAWGMVGCLVIVGFSFFGYVPPHFNDPLSPQMIRIFDLLTIGYGGYIARYGIRDIVKTMQIGSVLKAFISKKIL